MKVVEIDKDVLTRFLTEGAVHAAEVLEGLPEGMRLVAVGLSRRTPGVLEFIFMGDGTTEVVPQPVVLRNLLQPTHCKLCQQTRDINALD